MTVKCILECVSDFNPKNQKTYENDFINYRVSQPTQMYNCWDYPSYTKDLSRYTDIYIDYNKTT